MQKNQQNDPRKQACVVNIAIGGGGAKNCCPGIEGGGGPP